MNDKAAVPGGDSTMNGETQTNTSSGMPTVPATEYDALIDIVRVLVDERCWEPIEAVQLVLDECGTDAAEWLRRILIDGDLAAELFGDAPPKGDDHGAP